MYPRNYSGKVMHLKVLFVFSKNGPAFKIGHTDLDDVKNIVWEVSK